MQIPANMTDEASLAELGVEAVRLLSFGNIHDLANRFGYALALGREATSAIQDDLSLCLNDLRAGCLVPSSQPTSTAVKYFAEDEPVFFALIECTAPTDTGAEVLVELIVTSKGWEKHVTLEQISVAT